MVPTKLQKLKSLSSAKINQRSYFVSVKTRFPTSETEDYSHVDHGFIPRSDLTIPKNKEAVDKALKKILEFFEAH